MRVYVRLGLFLQRLRMADIAFEVAFSKYHDLIVKLNKCYVL
jgi:hypothetical protein